MVSTMSGSLLTGLYQKAQQELVTLANEAQESVWAGTQ